jgi:hypothetical protein
MDDAALWEAFRSSTLPEDVWNHRAHLRVAWLHLARWDIDEAHVLMRVGIVRLNAFHGLEETRDRGYHETLTRLWLSLVALARAKDARETSDAFLDAHPWLLDRKLPLSFYAKDTVMSLRARSIFVPPDLAEIALPSR